MNAQQIDSNRRILIIDDYRAIHEDFRKILCPGNEAELDAREAAVLGGASPVELETAFELVSAYQGAEGVELLRAALRAGMPFAMAFVDVRMPPGLDGIETAAKLWEIDPELQVVICTAYSDYSWQEMIKRAGKPDRLLILKKPFDTIEVLQLAHALTQKWRLAQHLRSKLDTLEARVKARTADLLAANERLGEQAALLDKARDAIIVQDLEGSVQYWNKSAERLYGWKASEAIGRKVTGLIYTDEIIFVDPMRMVLERGDWIGELRQVTKESRELTVEGRWTLVRDEAGEPKAILVINSDVTDKKELEAQILRAQRMDSIGALAGGIAHDLNNVLAPIMTGVALLQKDVTDPGCLGILEILELSARRGAAMVTQVLQFARGTSSQRSVVDVAQLIEDLRKMAADTFPKSIEIRTDVAEDLANVWLEPTQLHQLLLNLCVNARDAMPEGGVLTMTAENVTVDETYCGMTPDAAPGPHVMITVADTGVGIPPAVMEKMFDAFFTTKPVGNGTGLGLSTSLGIVRAHSGFINVTSDNGRGALFKVHLPAASENTSSQAAEESDLPRGSGETVLLVDDEASIRTITASALEEFGYRVVCANNGAEAIVVYAQKRGQIDLVLTDLMMPVMDGAATIRALRHIDPETRILVMSGLGASGPAVAAEAGVDHFLAKPYTAQTLLRSLRQALDTRPSNVGTGRSTIPSR